MDPQQTLIELADYLLFEPADDILKLTRQFFTERFGFMPRIILTEIEQKTPKFEDAVTVMLAKPRYLVIHYRGSSIDVNLDN